MQVEFRQRIIGVELRKDLDVFVIAVDRYRDKFLFERLLACYKNDDLFTFTIRDGQNEI